MDKTSLVQDQRRDTVQEKTEGTQEEGSVHIQVIDGEDKTETEILAIGIGHDVSRYYNRAIKITDVNELGDVMISQLSSLFETKNKYH